MNPRHDRAPGGEPGAGSDRVGTGSAPTLDQGGDKAGQARELYADLVGYGVPVILTTPHVEHHKKCKSPCDTELDHGTGWAEMTTPDATRLKNYRPGLHTAAMVSGHVLDAIDVDTKNGADIGDIVRRACEAGVVIVGMHGTPSGGAHLFVTATGIATSNKPVNGVDFRGGCDDGTGRGLVYLPGSSRPKYRGRDYMVGQSIQWDVLAGLDRDEQRDAVWAFLAGVGIKPRLTADAGEGKAAPTVGEALPADGLPDEVADLVADLDPETIKDRSARFHRLVGECQRAGLTKGQAITALTPWCEAVGKYVGRVEAEVARSWDKIEAEDVDAYVEQIAADQQAADDTPVVTLDQAHTVFRRWLGADYDTDAMDAALATVAVERLDGDPVWLLLVSGSGNAKTETVVACGVGAVKVSTVSGEAALLSGTPQRNRTKGATGGLLRQVGKRGVLVVKDVTSILSMDRTARQEVLAALREVHDGHWDRPVGTDGGKTLSWSGRVAVLGAVTTAWDAAHAVIATMGDRFVLLRMDSTVHRAAAGRQAIANTGHEDQMRVELSEAATGVLAGMDTVAQPVTDDEAERIMRAADLVTLARTGVEFDYRGDVVNSHAPEMPTRFAKELTQILRGAVSIGMDRDHALRLAIRCARDSMPPLRLAIIDDLAVHPDSTPTEVRKRIGKPRATVDRQLQALHMLGVCDLDEVEMDTGKTRWLYRLADGIDPACLTITRNVDKSRDADKERRDGEREGRQDPVLIAVGSNISGTGPQDDEGPFS